MKIQFSALLVAVLALLLAAQAQAAPPYWSLDVETKAEGGMLVVVWDPEVTDSGRAECMLFRLGVSYVVDYWTNRMEIPSQNDGESTEAYFVRLKEPTGDWPGWGMPIIFDDSVTDLCNRADPRYLRYRWEPVAKPQDPLTGELVEGLGEELLCGDKVEVDASFFPELPAGQEYREVATGRRTAVAACLRTRFPRAEASTNSGG